MSCRGLERGGRVAGWQGSFRHLSWTQSDYRLGPHLINATNLNVIATPLH